MNTQEWRKQIATRALGLLSELKRANDPAWVLLPPSVNLDVAIFQIHEEALDAYALLELNAHIELCHKRGCIVSIKTPTQEMQPAHFGLVEYYYKGSLILRLNLMRPTIDFANFPHNLKEFAD